MGRVGFLLLSQVQRAQWADLSLTFLPPTLPGSRGRTAGPTGEPETPASRRTAEAVVGAAGRGQCQQAECGPLPTCKNDQEGDDSIAAEACSPAGDWPGWA